MVCKTEGHLQLVHRCTPKYYNNHRAILIAHLTKSLVTIHKILLVLRKRHDCQILDSKWKQYHESMLVTYLACKIFNQILVAKLLVWFILRYSLRKSNWGFIVLWVCINMMLSLDSMQFQVPPLAPNNSMDLPELAHSVSQSLS